MEVIDRRESSRVAFNKVKNGETFLNPKGELCQKFSDLWNGEDERFNTIQLRTGIVSYSSDYDYVTPVEATVTFTDMRE